MSIEAIRFSAREGAVVLQVLEFVNSDYVHDRQGKWRDAKVEDLLEVARYTRAYDALDQSLASAQQAVMGLQSQVADVMTRCSQILDMKMPERR